MENEKPCNDKILKYSDDILILALDMAIEALKQDQKTGHWISITGHWIPITYYYMDDEEKKYYSERTGYDEKGLDIILNCPLPEDNETVLITDRLGNVEVDTFVKDCDGCYFECCDTEDVIAWMRLPEAYKGE